MTSQFQNILNQDFHENEFNPNISGNEYQYNNWSGSQLKNQYNLSNNQFQLGQIDENDIIKLQKTHSQNKENNNSQLINKQNQIEKSAEEIINENLISNEYKEKIEKIFHKKLLNYKNYCTCKYTIYQQLLNKNYIIEKNLDKGGQADIFEGHYQNSKGERVECVFKIYFDVTKQKFQQEINLMKSFECSINIVKIIDSFIIQSAFILILEKCKMSLNKELQMIKNKELQFTIDKLLQMVFDLLDGLIQFRIYNILHLDIKPANILITEEQNYCYSDFGISFKQQNIQNIDVCFFTRRYAAPEQMKNFKQVNFQSDVYSLGKTLQVIIQTFKQVNLDYIQKKEIVVDLIHNFENIIQDNMIQEKIENRQSCDQLHQQFIKQVNMEEFSNFRQKYLNKILFINDLEEYDNNKDISYFQQLKLFYSKNILNLSITNQIQDQDDFSINRINYYDKNKTNKYIESIVEGFQIIKTKIPKQAKNQIQLQNEFICKYQNFLGYSQDSLNKIMQINQESKASIIPCQNFNQFNFLRGFKQDEFVITFKVKKSQNEQYKLINLINTVALEYLEQNQFYNSIIYLQKSIEIVIQLYSENNPYIFDLFHRFLFNLGVYFKKIGQSKSALKYFQESFEIVRQKKDEEQFLIQLLNQIGLCYKDIDEYQKALEILLKSHQIIEQIYERNHIEISYSFCNIANCYSFFGQYQQSLKYALQSLEIAKLFHQGNHPIISVLLNNIGYFYLEICQYQISQDYFLEALEMVKQIDQKENHFYTAGIYNNLGVINHFLNKKKNALQYYQEAIKISKQIYKGKNRIMHMSLNNIGLIYWELGEFQLAKQYISKSFKMTKQIHINPQSNLAQQLHNIGMCCQELGEFQNALEYYLESLKIKRQIYQGNHQSIALSLHYLGSCFLDMKDYQQALKNLFKSLEIFQSIYDVQLINRNLIHIGQCYLKLQEYKNALYYLLKYIELKQQNNEVIDPKNSGILDYIAVCYYEMGEYQDAMKYLVQYSGISEQDFEKQLVYSYNSIEFFQNTYEIKFYKLIKQEQLKKQNKRNKIIKSIKNSMIRRQKQRNLFIKKYIKNQHNQIIRTFIIINWLILLFLSIITNTYNSFIKHKF